MSYRIFDDVFVTGTLVWYVHVCRRETWLMSRSITPYHQHPRLELGRAIDSLHSDRVPITLEGMKIDSFRVEDQTVIEVKTSSRHLESAMAQLNYYLYRLREVGVNARGQVYIPRKGQRIQVTLDEERARRDIEAVKEVVMGELPPPRRIRYCRKCAYRDFCWPLE
ncbi:CRISPR-associated protein Cas4 [Metallosphaera javensis (ex Sakai et al. 2022)]|uniref:CRISPR-associated protein Cas4 n=1 Tax=Metallosphaera javensis (ex Sakai et al. 2022) TaxID=2775498 RepID=UPI00258B99E9|nr:MAG: CRISPR-associated protein Cas4 [Metallosphaera javensis (ex Sakai et al. 2022)]